MGPPFLRQQSVRALPVVVPVPLVPRPVPLPADPGVVLALPTVLPELLLLPMLEPGVVLDVAPGVVGALPAPSVVEPLLEPVVPPDPVAEPAPMPDDDPIALVPSALPARAVFAQSGRVAPAPMPGLLPVPGLVLIPGLAGLLVLELLLPIGEVLELLELPMAPELPELLVVPGLFETWAAARPEAPASAAVAASVASLLLILMLCSFGKLWRSARAARPVPGSARGEFAPHRDQRVLARMHEQDAPTDVRQVPAGVEPMRPVL